MPGDGWGGFKHRPKVRAERWKQGGEVREVRYYDVESGAWLFSVNPIEIPPTERRWIWEILGMEVVSGQG